VRGKVEGDKGGDNAETDGAKGQPQAIRPDFAHHRAAHSWQGAAFTLSLFSVGFICVRLVLGNTITRYGGNAAPCQLCAAK
jgi:hypothetical protein